MSRKRRSWGAGSIVQLASGRWRARWYQDGRRCGATVDSREVAQALVRRALADAQAERHGLPRDARLQPTLAEIGEAWLRRREAQPEKHRAAYDDRNRWKNHVLPVVGQLRAAEVTRETFRALAQAVLDKGLSPATAGHCTRLLSSLFSDLVEDGTVPANPWTSLARRSKTRELVKPTYDSATRPFVETLDAVRGYYLRLKPRQVQVAYAIGAFAGLRPAEIQALDWRHVDLERNVMHVRVQATRTGRLKSGKSRPVEIRPELKPILVAWKLESGGAGLVVPPLRRSSRFGVSRWIRKHTLNRLLGVAGCPLTWYEATRHTFASHWVLQGGSMERLSNELGHSSVAVTERHYAHLRRSQWHPDTAPRFDVDLTAPAGQVVKVGTKMGHAKGKRSASARKSA